MSYLLEQPIESELSVSTGVRSFSSYGYNRKSFSSSSNPSVVESVLCIGSASFSPTHHIHVVNQFHKLVAKMNMTTEQKDTFERFVSALLDYYLEDKLIMEESFESEVVIGRRTESMRKIIVINEFGDLMYSIKSSKSTDNYREFIDYEDFEASSILERFLA